MEKHTGDCNSLIKLPQEAELGGSGSVFVLPGWYRFPPFEAQRHFVIATFPTHLHYSGTTDRQVSSM